jgi:hypothetical protein
MTRLAAWMLCAVSLSAAAAGAPAAAPAAPATRPASITFASHDGIDEWRADGTRGLWIRDRSKQWYYARFMGPCTGVNFAQTLAFKTEPNGSLDLHSSVFFKDGAAHEQFCPFKSFERSEPPPKAKAREQHPVQKPAPAGQ